VSTYAVTAVALLVLALVLGLVVVLIKRLRGGSADVTVWEEVALDGPAAQHAQALDLALRRVRGARVHQSGPGEYFFVVRRSPNWTLAFLPLFGLGFVLAVILSERWQLSVSLHDSEDGARVRFAGRTEERLWKRARSVVPAVGAAGTGA
jgi:hypothetical protein